MRQWQRSAFVQIIACRLFGTKPLSKPLLGYCQLDPSLEFQSKCKTFHSWKCIWKHRLRNGRQFVQGPYAVTTWLINSWYHIHQWCDRNMVRTSKRHLYISPSLSVYCKEIENNWSCYNDIAVYYGTDCFPLCHCIVDWLHIAAHVDVIAYTWHISSQSLFVKQLSEDFINLQTQISADSWTSITSLLISTDYITISFVCFYFKRDLIYLR